MTSKDSMLRILAGALAIAVLTPGSAAAELRGKGAVGAGFTYLATTDLPGVNGPSNHYGVALEARGQIRPIHFFGINFLFGWGLTEFERAVDVAESAIDAGAWTTRAFEDVTWWLGQPDGFRVLKWVPAFFAYAFLLFSYVAVPVGLIAALFAPTTYFDAGFTTSFHLEIDDFDGYLEVGLGGLVLIPPEDPDVVPGWGPMAGLGARYDWIGVGAKLLYSPPGVHDTIVGVDDAHIFVFSTTVDFYFK